MPFNNCMMKPIRAYSFWGFGPLSLSVHFNTHLLVLITVSHKNTPNTRCPVLGVHITGKKRFLIRQKRAFSPVRRLDRRGGLKPYTSRAGCCLLPAPPLSAPRQRAATPALPPRARRPPRLPRFRPGKPRKPPAPRRPATCPLRAAAPATRPLCASRGQARPRPASRRRPEGRLRLPALRKRPPRRPALRLARAAPTKTARAAPAEAHRRQCAAARLTPAQTARAAPAAFRCGPKGGSNPWAVPAGDRGPLSREFSQNSGVGVSPPKIKISRPFSDGCLHRKRRRASSRLSP